MGVSQNAMLKAGCVIIVSSLVAGCGGGGGGGGGVNTTPPPPVLVAPPPPPPPPPAPPPPPPPPPSTPPVPNPDTGEFRASNAVVQSGALRVYQAGFTGQGVIAAVVDSGAAVGNPEFAGRIHPASADLSGSRGLGDDGGHGTAVSSVLLGAKNDSITHGVAPGATLLVARTDQPGSCTNPDPSVGCSHADNDIARGVDLAVANRARVINISLGGSPANATLRNAIFRATAAGIVVVFSAGNNFDTDPVGGANPDPLAQVANDPQANGLVLVAGALDSSNAALTAFSNRAGNGAANYISALGSRVLAIDEAGTQFLFSGTSFSAPVISGAVALLAQAFPNLTGAQIVDLIKRSANDLGDPGVDLTFGNGALNLTRAFQPQGQTSVAGSAIPVALGQSAGMASAAMGDAGQRGMSTIITDGYGRAFEAQLGGVVRAAITPRLAPALGIGTRHMAFDTGSLAVSLSAVPGREQARAEALMLSPHAQTQSRAIAGLIAARLGDRTRIAFGIAQSADLASKGDAASRSLLVARAAGQQFGFERRAQAGFGLAQDLGRLQLSASAEQGQVRLWDREATVRGGYARYGYTLTGLAVSGRAGPFHLSTGIAALDETETVLGGRFAALYGTPGAASVFADASLGWAFAQGWQARGSWREGWTRVASGGTRIGTDRLRSEAWALDLTGEAVWVRNDVLAFRVAQPLRVTGGGFGVSLPTAFDYASGVTGLSDTRLSLAPSGREIEAEAGYGRVVAGGWLSANLFWRREPGHIAAAPDDLGAAIRFTLGL